MKTTPQELELTPDKPSEAIALRPDETLTVHSTAKMMQAVIDKGITPESVAVMERLMGLMERVDAKQAEKDFAKAFNALQAEMPSVAPSKIVPNNDGSARYRFAPYEEIMNTVRPLLLKHGFTVTFSTSYDESRIIQACTLQHTGGHSRTNSFAARIGRGPPGSSEAQGDGAASTYAKRFALCNALNITIEADNDGRNGGGDARAEGELISDDKIQYLKEQVREVGYKEESFLKLAGVGTYQDIREGSYGVLTRAIEMKRSANKKPA